MMGVNTYGILFDMGIASLAINLNSSRITAKSENTVESGVAVINQKGSSCDFQGLVSAFPGVGKRNACRRQKRIKIKKGLLYRQVNK